MKNKRSLIGIVAAVLLAVVGGLLLLQSSDESSSEAVEESVETASVLVAARDIDRGESASTLSENAYAFVRLESFPADQVKPNALVSTDNLGELALGRNVVARAIAEGVQLTLDDFVVPGQQDTSALPDVDDNVFEITVALEPQRALGGNVRAGQTVAIVGSFDPQDESPSESVVILESVQVTNVQTEQLFNAEQLSSDPLAPSLAPTSRLFVTFGVPVADLEKLTFANEFGRIWLARQGPAATVDGSEVRDRDNVVTVIGSEGAAADSAEGENGSN